MITLIDRASAIFQLDRAGMASYQYSILEYRQLDLGYGSSSILKVDGIQHNCHLVVIAFLTSWDPAQLLFQIPRSNPTAFTFVATIRLTIFKVRQQKT